MPIQIVKDYGSMATQLNSALRDVHNASQLEQTKRTPLLKRAEAILTQVGEEMKQHTERVVHIDQSLKALRKMNTLNYQLDLVKGQGETIHGWWADLVSRIKEMYLAFSSNNPNDSAVFNFREGDPYIQLPKFSEIENRYQKLEENFVRNGRASNIIIVVDYAYARKHQNNLDKFPKEQNQAKAMATALKRLGEFNGVDFTKIDQIIAPYLNGNITIDKIFDSNSLYDLQMTNQSNQGFYTNPKDLEGESIGYIMNTYLALQNMEKQDLSSEARARLDIGLKTYREVFTVKIDDLFSKEKPNLVTRNNEPSRLTEWAIYLKTAAVTFFNFEKNDPINALRLAQVFAEGQINYAYLNDEAKAAFEQVRAQIIENKAFDYKPFQVAYESEFLKEDVQAKETVIMVRQADLLEQHQTSIPEAFQALRYVYPGPYYRVDPVVRKRFEEVLLQKITASPPQEREVIRAAFGKTYLPYMDGIGKKIHDTIG